MKTVTIKQFIRCAANGATIKEIADKCGKSEGNVGNILSGRNGVISLKTLTEILEGLGERVVLTLSDGRTFEIINK